MISFYSTDSESPVYTGFPYINYMGVFLYNLYSVFPIYGISTRVPDHINVSGSSLFTESFTENNSFDDPSDPNQP